jgi:hypothetical protein
MTKDEALRILAHTSYMDRTVEGGPGWRGGEICLDGYFTADELRAILSFAPSEPNGL